jgi:hypothetical protein
MVGSFKDKSELGANYFRCIVKSLDGCSIQEFLHVVSKFLMRIGEEMNKYLEEEVIESEVKEIISSMQKGKIPGPNGFSIEFFLGFNDLLREYLLRIVKQSQRTGNILGSPNSTFLCLIPKKKNVLPLEITAPFLFAVQCIK